MAMTEKEFKKLRRQDLVRILLAQDEEASRLQEELEQKKEKLALLREKNEGIKETLNERDAHTENLKAWLDQRDARIRMLEAAVEKVRSDQEIELEQIGSLTEAARKLFDIFETAQRKADRYMKHRREV